QLKPTRLTAIDSEPLKSMNAKKILLKKAIREEFTLVMSHDQKNEIVTVSGDADDPKYRSIF
ncbi:MAG: metal-dependent hydrolase, partial [Thermoplasmataceae archaeon]